MHTATHIAKQFRDVYFGGNWTGSCLKEHLSGTGWEDATTQVHSFNTLATLAFHIHYYVNAATEVLAGKPLNAKDIYSFAHPPIASQEDWDRFLDSIWEAAEVFAKQIEGLPDNLLGEVFTDEKYGKYYRNLHGIIEHAHYHLGQIVLIKKLIALEKGDAGGI